MIALVNEKPKCGHYKAYFMSDDSEKNKKEAAKLDLGDWSPDYFPTSPKSVFKKALIWLLSIALLCTLLAIWSKSDSIEPNNTEKVKIRNIIAGTKQDEYNENKEDEDRQNGSNLDTNTDTDIF